MKRSLGAAGFSLIEVLLGMFILGSVVAAGLTGLFFTTAQTSKIGVATRTDLALANFADGMKQIPYSVNPRGSGASPGCKEGDAVGASTAAWYTTQFRTWVAGAGSTASSVPPGWLPASGTTPALFSGFSTSSFTVTRVLYWNPTVQPSTGDTGFWEVKKHCNTTSLDPNKVDNDMQKLTLRVSWSGGTKTIEVVKRRS